MTINSHLTEFGGYAVQQWNPGDPLPDPQGTICRISVEWDDEQQWVEKFRAFLDQPGAKDIRGFVVGWWSTEASEEDSTDVLEATNVLEALVAARGELTELHVLFFGDITSEENEVSWIQNTDLSPLLSAYPKLTHFGVRGGNGLSMGQLESGTLSTLIVQAGGLDASVIREVMSAKLPNLEHLELYLGTDGYGATTQLDDLTPILDGTLFPKLKYLGIKNSDLQDQIAQLLADAPVLEGLHTLDLSMGVLTDEGAQALLTSERVKTLKRLNVQHHFLTPDMIGKLSGLEIDVDVSDAQDPDEEWRFVSLSE